MPVNSLKRTSQEAEAEYSIRSSDISAACKRPCTSLARGGTDTTMGLLTPRKTPQVSAMPTMRLKLEIPQPEISKEEDRKLKIQKAAAERWQPKLKRPFPRKREIKDAYKNKLMRHYTDETTAPSGEWMKPHINRSARVDALRKGFPLLSTSAHGPQKSSIKTPAERDEENWRQQLLRENQNITQSEYAKKLAFEAFSARKEDRINRNRQAMMISGLLPRDIQKEKRGIKNALPDWIKVNTGRFAKAQQQAMSQDAAKGPSSN